MAINLIELGSKLAKCEIKVSDPEVREAQKALASLMKTEEGRTEVAEIVKIALEESYNKFDISPLIFEKKHFNYGDKPVFKTHKKALPISIDSPLTKAVLMCYHKNVEVLNVFYLKARNIIKHI